MATRYPIVWFSFSDAGGDPWVVYLSTRASTKALRVDKHGGPYDGRLLWSRRRIYINVHQSKESLFETAVHELAHVALRQLKLPDAIDESIVTAIGEGIWPILGSIPVVFPEMPEPAAKALRRRQRKGR